MASIQINSATVTVLLIQSTRFQIDYDKLITLTRACTFKPLKKSRHEDEMFKPEKTPFVANDFGCRDKSWISDLKCVETRRFL